MVALADGRDQQEATPVASTNPDSRCATRRPAARGTGRGRRARPKSAEAAREQSEHNGAANRGAQRNARGTTTAPRSGHGIRAAYAPRHAASASAIPGAGDTGAARATNARPTASRRHCHPAVRRRSASLRLGPNMRLACRGDEARRARQRVGPEALHDRGATRWRIGSANSRPRAARARRRAPRRRSGQHLRTMRGCRISPLRRDARRAHTGGRTPLDRWTQRRGGPRSLRSMRTA